MQHGRSDLWLLGSRVWAEYRLGHKPELYDFMGYDHSVYYFRRRRDGIMIGKTIYQLTNYPGFRPFLINLNYFDPAKLITSQPTSDGAPSPDGGPNAA
jgi:hypothetical protein